MTEWSVEVIICDLVLAVAINTSAMLLSSVPISFSSWYPGVASAFLTNVILQLVLPVPLIGSALSRPLEGKDSRWLLSVFVENLVFVTFISLTMAFVQHGAPRARRLACHIPLPGARGVRRVAPSVCRGQKEAGFQHTLTACHSRLQALVHGTRSN